MHRRKSSPLKQAECLQRDKTKTGSAACEINSDAVRLGHFGILSAEAHGEWERQTRGYVGKRAQGALQFSWVGCKLCLAGA